MVKTRAQPGFPEVSDSTVGAQVAKGEKSPVNSAYAGQ